MSMATDRDGCKWKDICISNLGEIIAGGTPSRAVPSYREGDSPWITPGEVIRMKGKNAKTNALKASVSQDNSADDVKSAMGPAYVEIKKLLGLTQCGNTKEEFCKATLAPLVTPSTRVYTQLKEDVFGGGMT